MPDPVVSSEMAMSDDGTLVLTGDLDEGRLPQLRELLDALLVTSEVCRVDLTAVDFLPSAAIGAIVRAAGRAEARGQGFAIIAAQGSGAARVLSVSGVRFVSPG